MESENRNIERRTTGRWKERAYEQIKELDGDPEEKIKRSRERRHKKKRRRREIIERGER